MYEVPPPTSAPSRLRSAWHLALSLLGLLLSGFGIEAAWPELGQQLQRGRIWNPSNLIFLGGCLILGILAIRRLIPDCPPWVHRAFWLIFTGLGLFWAFAYLH